MMTASTARTSAIAAPTPARAKVRTKIRAGGHTPAGPVVEARNLIPLGSRTDVLVGAPSAIDRGQAGTALLEDSRTDAWLTGRDLRLSSLDSKGMVETIATLPQPPVCAVPTPAGACVMTAAGPERLRLDARKWVYTPRPTHLPTLTLRAHSRGVMSKTLEHTILSVDSSDIDSSAAKRLTPTLLNRYTSLVMRAADAGLWIQPVVARYRLLDAGGATMFVSTPVLCSADDGWQCIAAMDSGVTIAGDTLTIENISLQATAFDIEAVWDDDVSAEDAGIGAVEIELCPQLHPVDYSRMADVRIDRRASASPHISMALPGVTSAFAPMHHARAARLSELIARINHNSDIRVVRLHRSDMSEPRVIANAVMMQPRAECESLQRTLRSDITDVRLSATALTLHRCSMPHSFTATQALADGDIVLWANVGALPWTGPTPMAWSSGEASKRRKWSLRIVLDGHVIGRDGDGCFPDYLSALMCYPDAAATSLTLAYEGDDGRLYARTFGLQPTPDGRMAVAVAENLQRIDTGLFEAVNALSDIDPASADIVDGMLLQAAATDPLKPTSALRVTTARVMALTQAVRSQSSWDFARTHVYAFATDGIYAVAVHSSRRLAAATLIDPRGVDSPQSVAFTPDGIMAACRHEIVRVSGSRAQTFAPIGGIRSIAWWRGVGQLLLDGGDDRNILALSVADKSTYSLCLKRGRLHGNSSRQFIIAADGHVYETAMPGYSPMSPVSWKVRVNTGFRPLYVELDMTAKSFDGVLRVTADGGAGIIKTLTVTGARVRGRLSRPLRLRLQAPDAQWYAIEFRADVSNDFILRSATFWR